MGVIGEVRYPIDVNTVEVRWPDGVYDNELVVEHDRAILDFTFV